MATAARRLELRLKDKIALTHEGSEQTNEQSSKAKVALQMLFESAAECEKLKPIWVPANEQNFDRLRNWPEWLDGMAQKFAMKMS